MAKIPFDIKYRPQIESGEYKVETGDKKQVRIICWNRKVNDFPITALAYDAQKDVEIFINTSVLGEPHTNIASDRLFIVTPEEEPSDWEKAVGLALTDYQLLPRDKDGIANIHDIEEFTKKKAIELLALAKEECKNQIENDYREIIHGAYDYGKTEALKDLEESGRVHCKSYDIGYDDGARDALKDLPRWRTWGNGACGGGESPIALVKTIGGYRLTNCLGVGGENYLMLSDLEKLPKEG